MSNEPRAVDQLLTVMYEADTLVRVDLAESIVRAGWRPPPRRITDPAELDRLPYFSVVLAYGVAHQAVPDEHGVDPVWFKPTEPRPYTSLELLAAARGKGVTVLHEPEEAR